VPLSFLAAERDFDAAGDVALPFGDHDQWRRPYRPGPWRVGVAAVLLLLASFVLFSTVIIAFTGGPSAAGVTAVVAALLTALALRMLRMGTWVSNHGVRRVALLHTSTLAWGQVSGLRTVQQPVRWLGLPRTVQGQALVLNSREGDPMPLLTTHNADFLGRDETFDRAADTVEAWGAQYGAGRP
jgi:hypothetical protein